MEQLGNWTHISVDPVSHSVALDTGYLGGLFKAYVHFLKPQGGQE